MCGLTGIISLNGRSINKEQLIKMNQALSHRGPDSDGFWYNDDCTVGFGHRRLSIIDLSDDGRQPFIYQNRYVIVFNGEIYNYIELRKELEKRGVVFKTKTDTEVLAALYHQYGKKMFDRLDGMFSFVIYDLTIGHIFGARDRFGEKPLYYTIIKDCLYFASEIKSFWAAGLEKAVDQTRLYYYLKYSICEFPEHNSTTFFKGVKQILPSHYFELHNNELKSFRYWELSKVKVNTSINFTDAVVQLKEIFNESLSRRLRSDVPVGSSLSGGVDSSIVVKSIQKIKSGQQKQKTFSARFKNFAKDEGKYIELILTNASDIESYYAWPDAEDFKNEIEKVLFHQDEPIGSASIIAQWNVMKLARKNNVTVLMDGQGADEIFAGYLSFVGPYLNELYKNDLKEYHKQRDSFEKLLGYTHDLSLRAKLLLKHPYLFSMAKPITSVFKKTTDTELNVMGFTKEFIKEIASERFVREKRDNDSLHKALENTIWNDGLPTLLRYADRNSMAHSIEVRLPYLSHLLAEFSFSLPPSYKMNNGYTKYILRKSFEGLVPDEILWRKDKIGYEAPQSDWLKLSQKKIKEAEIKLLDLNVIDNPSAFDQWNLLIASHYL